MVCTQHFTFNTFLGERRLPMPHKLCFPVIGLQAPANVAQLIFWLYSYGIMMQQYHQNLKFLGGGTGKF